MKITVLVFVALFLAIVPAQSQLQKGDIELGFSSSYSNNNYSEILRSQNVVTFQSALSFGKMINDRTMIGTGLLHYSSTGGIDFFSGRYQIKNFYLKPFARYYFVKKEKLYGFGFVNTVVGYYSIEYEQLVGPQSKGWPVHAEGGFGVQYFLAPNIALLAETGTILYENDAASNLSKLFYTTVGIRTLMNDRTEWKGNLMNRYLKKGNYVLSGNFNLISNDIINTGLGALEDMKTKPMQTDIAVTPEVKYFVKDKLAVSVNPGLSGSWNGYFNTFNYSLGIGVEAYLPLGEFIYFVPSVYIQFGKTRDRYYTTQAIVTPSGGVLVDTVRATEFYIQNSGKIDLGIKYFANNATLLSAGTYYRLNNFVINENDYRRTVNAGGVYAEAEYFFAKNISLKISANYALGESRFEYDGAYPYVDSQDNRSIRFDLMVSYFIFK